MLLRQNNRLNIMDILKIVQGKKYDSDKAMCGP